MNKKMYHVYSRRAGFSNKLVSIFVTDTEVPNKNDDDTPLIAAEFPVNARFDEDTQTARAVTFCNYLNDQLIEALAAVKKVRMV